MPDFALLIQPVVTVLAALVPVAGKYIAPRLFPANQKRPPTGSTNKTAQRDGAVWIVLCVVCTLMGFLIGDWLTPPILVSENEAGLDETTTVDLTLTNGEIIVGDAWMVDGENNDGHGCIAFLAEGPGRYHFDVTAGRWQKFRHVLYAEQAERLLTAHVDILAAKTNQYQPECPKNMIEILRLSN